MLPKKGLRKIVVNGQSYAWVAKCENDIPFEQVLKITIVPSDNHKRLLQFFQHFDTEYKVEKHENGSSSLHTVRQKNAITNKLVSQIIVAALKNGWEKAADGLFHSDHYKHDLTTSPGSTFNLARLKTIIEEGNYANHLDIEADLYLPADGFGYGELYYLFYQETEPSNGISPLSFEYSQNENFIIKMLVHYAHFRKIAATGLNNYLSSFKFENSVFSEKEIEMLFVNFLPSVDVPSKYKALKIKTANFIFKEDLSYAIIAKTETALIGLIWDHPG